MSDERVDPTDAERIRKLQAFKDWVHNYLDQHGVPHHPPGTHGAAGCRIGDRMDWLMAEVGRARLDLLAAQQHLACLWNDTGSCPCGARRESPRTRPHVIRCPTAAALKETP